MNGAELQGRLRGFLVEQIDPATALVTTPFFDKDGNAIRVFIRQRGSQYYLFNEKEKIPAGESPRLFTRQGEREHLREILRRFDVYNIDGEISTEATGGNLAERLCNLVQALILLDGMF